VNKDVRIRRYFSQPKGSASNKVRKTLVLRKPSANSHSCISLQHRALCIKTFTGFLVAGDINLP